MPKEIKGSGGNRVIFSSIGLFSKPSTLTPSEGGFSVARKHKLIYYFTFV